MLDLSIKNRDGGTDLTGFRQALTRTINNYANEYKLLKEARSGVRGAEQASVQVLPR